MKSRAVLQKALVSGRFILLIGLVGAHAGTAVAKPLFPAPMFQVGDNPRSVTAADFNGDGAVDLAVTTYTPFVPGGISIFLGGGDGRFGPEMRITLGSPGALASGDFNQDGKVDLAVADGGHVLILLGAGDGTFSLRSSNDAGAYPGQVVVADLNRDGIPDLAVACYSQFGVSVLLGVGDGSFLPASLLSGVALVRSIVAVDFNRDGNVDLATTGDSPGDAAVLMGQGTGQFDPPVNLGAPQSSNSWIATADFDGDGNPDLAVTHQPYPAAFVALLGNGRGGIRARFPMQIPRVVGSWAATGDFNGDGITDLVVNSSLFAGHGDGTFDPPESYPGSGPGGVVADFDSNGSLDLALVKGDYPGFVTLLLNDGHGVLGPRGVPGGDGATMVTTGDFDSDRHLDLAAGFRSSGQMGLILGHGDGSFTPQPPLQVGDPEQGPGYLLGLLTRIAAGDFDGDGRLDLAATTFYGSPFFSFNFVAFLKGTGDGNLLSPIRTLIPGGGFSFTRPVVADFNGDGRQDLAYTTGGSITTGHFGILQGRSDGSFDSRFDLTSSLFGPLAMGDFDRDGTLDMAAVSYFGEAAALEILVGHGDGTFGSTQAFGSPGTALASADFNGDGKLDLAVAHFAFVIVDPGPAPGGEILKQVSIFLGNGDGTFGPETRFDTGLADTVAAADFDQDGRVDLLVSNVLDCSYSILPGLGDGSFGPGKRFAGCGEFSLGDFNEDGRVDIVFDLGAPFLALNQGATPNRPPVANAGADVQVECASRGGAEVHLDGSASRDPDSTPTTQDDIVAFDWFEHYGLPNQEALGSGASLTVTLPLGEHRITLRVTDRAGATSTDEVAVRITDGKPPRIRVDLSPSLLWPPDNQMVNVAATVDADDACGDPTVRLISIEADETVGVRLEDLSDDVQGADVGTSDFAFQLRARKYGRTRGLVYVVTYDATDAAGNRSTATASVRIPHSRSRKEKNPPGTPSIP